MGIKRKLFNSIARFFIKLLRLNKANKVNCGFAEMFAPLYNVRINSKIGITFFCPNELTRWRAETFFTKEPETIEWINTFKKGDILFDIGANVGLYSLYTAKKGIDVVAFEPESQNYALLNKNIYLNRCQDKIICLNIALSDEDSINCLYMSSFQWGGAINSFGKALDEQGEKFNPVFKQGVISYTLDSFLSRYHIFPNHIKIDVDGIEPKILKGSEKTLKDVRLKSLLIELNEELPEHTELIEKLRANGLRLSQKRHAEMFETGKYSKIFNYIFERS